MKIKFVISSPISGNYYTGIKENPWTMYVSKLKKEGLFDTYLDAEKAVESLPSNFYQIEKIFKV